MKIRTYIDNINREDYESFVIGGDIGGTHTNLAVAGVKNEKTVVLFSTHFDSQKLDSLVPAIQETLEYGMKNYEIEVEKGCAGVAGAVSGCSKSKLTNVPWEVDAQEIETKTGIKEFYIINDFQVIGYGIESIPENDLFVARKGSPGRGETRAIIGAGTGLGKTILIFDGKNYTPISSEGGHGDLPLHDQFDMDLAEHIKAGRETPISYEDVLSGHGIERIYGFLEKELAGNYAVTDCGKEIERSEEKAVLISKYRDRDRLSAETFKIFAKYYGRCSKNFVLDALATGGLYIAGGIATKNKEIFVSQQFQEQFLMAEKQKKLLEKTPIYIILNYDVSLYGACNAATRIAVTCLK
jgi:glucokinase